MNPDNNSWYLIDNIEDIDTPALVIYPERVNENIQVALEMVGDPARLRPHAKTHKSAEVTGLMMKAGISRFKCATIPEAEMLASCNATDVLLAYQPVGPKLKRFIELITTFPGTTFSCLVDSIPNATKMAPSAEKEGVTITALIDLNVGMNRTGAQLAQAMELLEVSRSLAGLNIIGIHAYDGHIVDADLQVRQQRSGEAFQKVEALQQHFRTTMGNDPVIVMGGSPTYPAHATRQNIQTSPGTFVYWDNGYANLYPDMKFKPAALVVSRIISLIDDTTVCVDLGHKSIASENPIDRRVWFINEPNAKFISHSEEHLVLALPAGHNRNVGDVLYGVPFHICPTCALYDRANIIEDHEAASIWRMAARDRVITI
ncbi:D-TA family PLP-dependent enzyme [Segetibacter sp. 3557_3]|uniref:D-TA family PLP-dependent enzyme n=1 Tax=Segetibacter sp. 3557_3 TaxID=2547429 RepID=UPI001058F2B2|nr:D-TA family PLP-dependent enzyme [Segetibacter sp. 3557_3]TDH18407.1 D-TA family PLP-dependent enzyme [Segetibacter sp. 3557_3]